MHRGLLLCIAILLATCTLAAKVEEAPIPPPPKRWVNDDVALLSPATRAAVDSRLEAYERATGHQVVVWISNTIGNAPLDEFATRVFEAWKIGRQGKDDGVLVLVLKDDRRIAVEVGYGLEDRVPDAIASRGTRTARSPRVSMPCSRRSKASRSMPLPRPPPNLQRAKLPVSARSSSSS